MFTPLCRALNQPTSLFPVTSSECIPATGDHLLAVKHSYSPFRAFNSTLFVS